MPIRCASLGPSRGFTLIATLVALVVLLITSLALVRSFDTSLGIAGAMSFRRDLVNQSERGLAAAIASMNSGGLVAATTREANAPTLNYSASRLASNARGIPLALLSNTLFAASFSGADIVDADSGVSIRYVIDRQCTDAGTFTTASCGYVPGIPDSGGTAGVARPDPPPVPVYRISVRVTGPRDTQTFIQATVNQ